MKHLFRGLGTLIAISALIAIVAGCGGTDAAAPSQEAAQPVAATTSPTVEPTNEPVKAAAPTVEPDTEAQPITVEEIEAAIATEDCEAILAIGDEARIKATFDMEALDKGIESLTYCATGEFAVPATALATIPLGETARAGDWDVKVNGKVNWNAWKVVKKENMFNEPIPKGYKMVLVPLVFTNRGDAKANLLGSGVYLVGDGTGIERTDFDDPTCGVIPKPLDFFVDVRPGGSLKGNMCFAIEDKDIKTLRMGVPQGMFSSEPDIEFALR